MCYNPTDLCLELPDMDERTQRAVTRALDTAISDVAAKWFEELARGLSDQDIANKVYGAFASLERLKSYKMPCYDDWDALFYSVWYQPAHINLAYTLVNKVPRHRNPLLSGIGSLEIFDFGCGALAMQFGLTLAAADALYERGTFPRIVIISCDASKDIREIGWKIWKCFTKEIANCAMYPELGPLRHVCRNMQFERSKPKGIYPGTRWLTVLHVTYKENAAEVKKELDERVANESQT